MRDTPQIVLGRIRMILASRRACGLAAAAMGLRVQRVIDLAALGCLSPEQALHLSLEAEAMAVCMSPLPSVPCPTSTGI
ncbi:hypothetical protein A3862_04700 [Methylobacterium sp. XJLW]|jgi:hypothetical protein|uniref:hypothetical protein n=1 Tax=Methylobacterium sp. XJLW TaxID=739141 RepID=UPI000DAB0B95|nr:hypothetical protein [Methylobacterium sp. XJLW]AWV19277.1 hypothetical protein A3862_04700 [Methylobacterium sp. XJLW]